MNIIDKLLHTPFVFKKGSSGYKDYGGKKIFYITEIMNGEVGVATKQGWDGDEEDEDVESSAWHNTNELIPYIQKNKKK